MRKPGFSVDLAGAICVLVTAILWLIYLPGNY
jgi:hypothetical protein